MSKLTITPSYQKYRDQVSFCGRVGLWRLWWQVRPFAWCITAILMTACVSSPTAAGVVAGQATAHPAIIATAQADQYRRDAEATVNAQVLAVEAVAIHIEQTAIAGTATYEAQMAQATATTGAAIAQATATAQYQQTADALSFVMTAEVATAKAQAIALEATHQSVYATATTAAEATTSSFQATRAALEIEVAARQAQQEEIKSYAVLGVMIFLCVLVLCLGIYAAYLVWPLLANRLKFSRFGQHGNPLFVDERNGRVTIIDPQRMLQAGIVMDEQGNMVMPEMSPNNIQAMVAAGVLQVLREQARYAPGHTPVLPNEITRRLRVGRFEQETTTRHEGAPTVTHPVLPGLSAPLPQLSAISAPIPLPQMPIGHVMITGPTDAGKSTAMRAILTGRPSVVVLDPHAAPGDWNAEVIGGGRDFGAIEKFMGWMMQELDRRAKLRAQKKQVFDPLTVATDEMPAIAQELGRGPSIIWRQWVREGRKFGLFFVVSTQSTRVKTLGIEGEGDLLENFKYVLLLGETAVGEYPDLVAGMQRPAVLKTLQGVQPVIIPQVPNVSAAPIITASAATQLPLPPAVAFETEWGSVTPEQVEQIRRLTAEGKSGRFIEGDVFGYTGGNAYHLRQAVLRATATEGEFRPLL